MESKQQTELTSKTETDSELENRMTASSGLGACLGGVGIEQKEKELMDMDNSLVFAGEREV